MLFIEEPHGHEPLSAITYDARVPAAELLRHRQLRVGRVRAYLNSRGLCETVLPHAVAVDEVSGVAGQCALMDNGNQGMEGGVESLCDSLRGQDACSLVRFTYTNFMTCPLDETIADQFLHSFHLIARPAESVRPPKVVGPRKTLRVQVAPDEWYRAVSPDRDFVVEFPGQPKYEARLNAQTGAQVQGLAFPFGDLQFILTFQELLDPPETPAERDLRLKEVQTGVLSDRKLALVRQVRLPDGGLELLCQTQLNGRPAFMLLHLYVHGTRVYVLTCTAHQSGKGWMPLWSHGTSLRSASSDVGALDKWFCCYGVVI